MANPALGSLLHYLRRLYDHAATEATDGELLRRHVGGDQAAFAALVRRHTPMVWSVCRRLLVNEQDAEDAFQAAFLVLLRKAESLRVPQSVAAFLHGVASRIARKAQVTAQRRRHHEAQAEMPRSSDPFVVVEQQELRTLLDEELDRLPEKYRAPKKRQEPPGELPGILARFAYTRQRTRRQYHSALGHDFRPSRTAATSQEVRCRTT